MSTIFEPRRLDHFHALLAKPTTLSVVVGRDEEVGHALGRRHDLAQQGFEVVVVRVALVEVRVAAKERHQRRQVVGGRFADHPRESTRTRTAAASWGRGGRVVERLGCRRVVTKRRSSYSSLTLSETHLPNAFFLLPFVP